MPDPDVKPQEFVKFFLPSITRIIFQGLVSYKQVPGPFAGTQSFGLSFSLICVPGEYKQSGLAHLSK